MKSIAIVLALALFPACVFAVDGQALINQSTVMAAGGFPYKILQPGSYKLSGNLVVTTIGTDAIEIDSDNVTLDLNGFAIIGSGTCTGSPLQCTTQTSRGVLTFGYGNTVKNGAVQGFGYGVYVTGSGTVEDVQVKANTLAGIYVAASSGAVLARCTAVLNGQRGIFAVNAAISDSVANANGVDGFDVTASTLIHIVANSNGGIGVNSTDGSVVGSSLMISNPGGDLVGLGSQHNNSCTAGSC
jgi:hypothetical protein